MNLNIEGLNVHYVDLGAGENIVLFLHGWGAPVGLYQPIFDLLVKKGYRVVAFDMPGVGETPEPAQALTVADYVRFTLEFCRLLGLEDVILMCHSHGGRIALSLLSDPACSVRCRKAVFIDATGVVLPKSTGAKLRGQLYHTAKKLGTWKLTRPLFGELYEEMRDKRSSADYKAASPVMRQTMNNVLPADFTGVMPDITAEILLIWGDRDTATPLVCGQTMERLIPGAGLAVIRNAGHFSYGDNWPQFSAVLDAFL